MRSSALAAALAAALCVLPAGHGHLGTAPGRFFAGVSGTTGDDAPPPPIPVNPGGGGGNASCATAFSLNGSKYDVSALQVDVGGWVAENSVDKFSYCINVCAVVTSERNCICYPCGATEYPASQVDKDPVKGETCEAYLGELKSSTWSASTDPEKPGITLTYGDGQQGKSTELALICDESVSGLDTGPSFVGSAAAAEPSVFRFEWVTSAACPLNSTQALA